MRADPQAALRQLLERHKAEVTTVRLGQATALEGRKDELMLLHEGLTQSWIFMGEAAVGRAKTLATLLLTRQKDVA